MLPLTLKGNSMYESSINRSHRSDYHWVTFQIFANWSTWDDLCHSLKLACNFWGGLARSDHHKLLCRICRSLTIFDPQHLQNVPRFQLILCWVQCRGKKWSSACAEVTEIGTLYVPFCVWFWELGYLAKSGASKMQVAVSWPRFSFLLHTWMEYFRG